MPGLPFPTNAVFAREDSYDYSANTPLSNAEDIPIDPALNGPPIDPAILGEGTCEPSATQGPDDLQRAHLQRPERSPFPSASPHRQYSQGPQGDPFAPQLPLPHLQPEEQPARPQKPLKKKRKPRREEECGFCQGNDSKNKDGEPERMLACEECGRSGHPTCMKLGQISDVVRSYPWKCIECKNCEICHEKGDDNRILFCDFCDRGWHMDCLQPPLEEEPPGKWHCPMCPLIEPVENQAYLPHSDVEIPQSSSSPPRASSVASTSHSMTSKSKGKGKAKLVVSDDSSDDDDDEEEEVDVVSPVVPTKGKRHRQKKSSKKGKDRATDEEAAGDGSGHHQSARPPKRMRLKLSSPAPAPKRMIVRLRLPPRGKEEPETPPKGLFDDVLSVEERDTSKTVVEVGDKLRFEKSRLAAEEKLVPPPPASAISEPPDTPVAGPSSRPLLRSTAHHHHQPTPGPSASPGPSTPGPSAQTKAQPSGGRSARPLRIKTIRFGEYDVQTWFDAPFPEEYANIPDGRLWICEFCLKYMRSRFQSVRHRMKCKARHPPGDEIYRDGTISIFEVDGRKNKIYCQNLCLLSKMFLDHKSLFYDVEPFLFYVMTEVDEIGARFVGYFSKEKRSPKDYNVSCIMTLPVRQRQGWGNLLIDFSYLLSKKEQRVGSPEKPLSGLGALGYKNYWTLVVMRYLHTGPEHPRLEDISTHTSMTIEDVYSTLVHQNMITVKDVTSTPSRPTPGHSIKFPRGRKNGVARRHLQRPQTKEEERTDLPFVQPTEYEIHWDPEEVDRYMANWEAKGYLTLKPEKLKWSPFLLARTRKSETSAQSAEQSGQPSLAKADPAAPSASGQPLEAFRSLIAEADGRTESPSLALFDDDKDVMDARSTNLRDILSASPVRRTSSAPNEGEPERPGASAMVPSPLPEEPVHATPPGDAAEPSQSGPVHNKDQVVLDDAAFAAQLAREESQSKRQLRSRASISQQDLKRPAVVAQSSTASASRTSSPRKRRRVDSSPEPETVAPVSPTTSQQPQRRLNGKAPRKRKDSVVTASRNGKTARRPNGTGAAAGATAPRTLKSTRSMANGSAAGAMNGTRSPSPPSPAAEDQMSDHPAHADVDEEMRSPGPERILPTPPDVKSEETSTPFMSRRSEETIMTINTGIPLHPNHSIDRVISPLKETFVHPHTPTIPHHTPSRTPPVERDTRIITQRTSAVRDIMDDDDADLDVDAEGEPDEELVLW